MYNTYTNIRVQRYVHVNHLLKQLYDDTNSYKIKNPCLSKIVCVCPRGIVKHSLVQWLALKATRASWWKRWPPPTTAQPLEYVTQKKEILFFPRKNKNRASYYFILVLTQTVDFSSPGPKEFDYFCFKQYKWDTILRKYILY